MKICQTKLTQTIKKKIGEVKLKIKKSIRNRLNALSLHGRAPLAQWKKIKNLLYTMSGNYLWTLVVVMDNNYAESAAAAFVALDTPFLILFILFFVYKISFNIFCFLKINNYEASLYILYFKDNYKKIYILCTLSSLNNF